MNKKKFFLIVLLVLLIGFVLLLYNAFNGNPISKFLSKKVLEHYLEEMYPEKEYVVDDGFYNFKYSAYGYTVTEIGSADHAGNSKEYEFNVTGFLKLKVSWDGIYYDNLDQQMANHLSKQIHEELYPLLTSEIDSIHRLEIQLEVLEGKFADNVSWSKELVLDKPMAIYIQFDSTEQTKEDFALAAEQAKNILDEHGYEYEHIIFNGSGFDLDGFREDEYGYLKYAITLEKDETVKIKDVEEENEDMW